MFSKKRVGLKLESAYRDMMNNGMKEIKCLRLFYYGWKSTMVLPGTFIFFLFSK
jgi:hypothetical protein